MPDLDVVDRALDALTRDLAHAPSPGASAAMATVRKRRRTRVGAVALAALVVVGGGLTVPRLVLPEDGAAAGGGSAPFDVPALERATEGWIDGWRVPRSPADISQFEPPGCLEVVRSPEPAGGGVSYFTDAGSASAVMSIGTYADTRAAVRAEANALPSGLACGVASTIAVDGLEVRHRSFPDGGDGARLTDYFMVQVGDRLGEVHVAGTSGAADGSTATRLAQALVAGVRDGSTQSDTAQSTPRASGKGPLPEWPDDVDLTGALAGWRSPTKRAATTSPNLLCLHDRLDGATTSGTTSPSISSAGGSPWGLSYRVAGYDDPAGGAANVELVLDELRACSTTDVTVETLPNGVHVATYDTGGPEPANAIWLAANGDRAGMVAVERAGRPMPAGVREDVADALVEILHVPWE